ncbi:MAG: hypothetical protein Q4A27_02935 [bacterium]|nr:hypothetical protein [bacterium]
MDLRNQKTNFKRGGVSMFIVVIACTLIALMVASFMRITIRDNQNASNQDLSQSAYDSAQVGVEDAKRFMTKYAAECANGYDMTNQDCVKMANALAGNSCNMLHANGAGVIANATGETKVQTSTSSKDGELDQAYTCVKITRDTADYIGQLTTGQSKIVPLRGTSGFNQIRLSWHSKEDLTNSDQPISLENVYSEDAALTTKEEWGQKINRPTVIKAQYFGYNSGITSLNQLDDNFSNDGNGLDEQIYYPASSNSTFARNRFVLPSSRRTDNSSSTQHLSLVKCSPNLTTQTYACSTVIYLGHTVNPSDTAFVRLTPIYKNANFKVELLDVSGRVVNFNGVQPEVDSTGRANDKYRRVQSRVEFVDQNFPVPDFAIQLEDANQAFCKNFWVTNTRNGNLDCK